MGETKGAAIEKIPVGVEDGIVLPSDIDGQLRVAAWVVESGLVPVRTQAAAWMVMQRGAELGYSGLASFDYLYVVGGRVRVTPDGLKARAQASGLIEDAKEEILGEGMDMVARCTIKRRGLPTPVVGEFSVHEAVLARLWGKKGAKGDSAWVTYPKRMLLARARGYAYQDAFRDLAGGLAVREMDDLDPGEKLGDGEAVVVTKPAEPPEGGDPLLAGVAEKLPSVEEVLEAQAVEAETESRSSTAEHPPGDTGLAPEGDAGSTPAGATKKTCDCGSGFACEAHPDVPAHEHEGMKASDAVNGEIVVDDPLGDCLDDPKPGAKAEPADTWSVRWAKLVLSLKELTGDDKAAHDDLVREVCAAYDEKGGGHEGCDAAQELLAEHPVFGADAPIQDAQGRRLFE